MTTFFKKNDPTRGYGYLEKFLAKKRADKANSLIPEKKRKGKILDVGCGVTPYFLINTRFKDKYGTDPSAKITAEDKSIKLMNVSLGKEKTPFNDNFFDTVTMLAVFEHIEEEKINFFLRDIRRVLKENGLLIITTPSPWAKFPLWLFSKLRLVSKIEIEDHKHSLGKDRIIKLLIAAGFKSENIAAGFFESIFNMWFKIRK